MEKIAAKLLKKKEEIDQAKLEKAQTEGALKQNMATLKEKFGVSTLEAAEKKLKSLKADADELEDKINEAVEKLEEEYGEL